MTPLDIYFVKNDIFYIHLEDCSSTLEMIVDVDSVCVLSLFVRMYDDRWDIVNRLNNAQ